MRNDCGDDVALTPVLVVRALEFIKSVARQLGSDVDSALPLVIAGTDLFDEPSIGVDWSCANPHPDHDEIESAVRRAFILGLNYVGDQGGRPMVIVETDIVETEGSVNGNTDCSVAAVCTPSMFLSTSVGDRAGDPAGSECNPNGCVACRRSCDEVGGKVGCEGGEQAEQAEQALPDATGAARVG